MIYGASLLDAVVELDGITTIVSAVRVGFIFFVWPLRGVLFRVNFK